jgi:hypothetical protein
VVCQWIAPAADTVKINTDASFCESSGRADGVSIAIMPMIFVLPLPDLQGE